MVLNKKIISLFEIFLIVFSSVSFAYLISETNDLIQYLPSREKESKFLKWIKEKTLNYLAKGLVSAQQIGLETCLLDNNGAICQEYSSTTCDSQCTSSCFPGRRTDFADCRLGTCYDSQNGVCNDRSPKFACENQGGVWSENTPAQCNRGCCLINPDGSGGANQAQFASEIQCNRLGRSMGAIVSWEASSNELSCLAKARTKREGACILDLDIEFNKYNCVFTTDSECRTRGGNFYAGNLCTNPQLNTKCEMTENTQCLTGKDGVYFVDSCGNKANIYNSNKIGDVTYWSNVVSPDASCSLSYTSNGLSNEEKCGNCDYLAGSICGTPSANAQEPEYGDFICKDLGCVDRYGEKRKHGESWCVFEGKIGLDGVNGTNEERSTDVVGSRHYRELCYNGEVRLEPCQEGRKEVCVENDINEDFTNARCRINKGNLCASYNEDADRLLECEEDSDCFLKHVEINDFKFDMCVPKYPLGFELEEQAEEDSKAICGFATQTCTYYEKKNIEGRWECKINCDCKGAVFAEKMNNLCMSLGDCGTKTNLAGEIGKGYSTSGDQTPKVSEEYKNDLKRYATNVRGQKVSPASNELASAIFGITPRDFSDVNKVAKLISQVGLGAIGLMPLFGGGTASAAAGAGVGAGTKVIAESEGQLIRVPTGTQEANAAAQNAAGGFTSALQGAAAGAGVGYIIGLAFGLEGDQMNTAVAIGAIVGFVIFYFVSWVPVIGWIVGAVAAILQIAGVGEYREKKVTFTCLPWEPPNGGDNCEKCDGLGVECTAYKCRSLGKTCELVNPQTEEEACISVDSNDATAPVLSLNSTSLKEGFTYQEFTNGAEIKNSEGDGCIQEYTAVSFGILTSERAQCKISSTRPDNGYDEMGETYFDSSMNGYVFNHVENTAMNTLDELGVTGINPDRRGEYNLYVSCIDRKGNYNEAPFNLRFCVSPANDVQPPQITKFVPQSPGLVGLNSEHFDLRFYTNEPSTCRFSFEDKDYSLMEEEAICQNSLSQSTLDGWLCTARLNIVQDQNKYYFRCADQPWLGVNIQTSSVSLSEGRNSAAQSIEYEIKKTEVPLTIKSVIPDNKTITSSSQPVSVKVEVETSGGIDGGKAFCKYSFDGNRYIDFYTTGENNHRNTFSTLFAGDYNIGLLCTDKAGNVANENAEFKIEVDNDGPIITRVYNAGTNLKVVTNERSVCAYSVSDCLFEFSNGTLLSGSEKVHTFSYKKGITYNVKCRDNFENAGSCISLSSVY